MYSATCNDVTRWNLVFLDLVCVENDAEPPQNETVASACDVPGKMSTYLYAFPTVLLLLFFNR